MSTLIHDPTITMSVVDQSIPAEESTIQALDTSLAYLIPGFSSKGVDNKIIEHKSPASLTSLYGDDFGLFKKYGMANSLALAITRSRGRVFFCRLLPDNAARSYAMFGVSVSKELSVTQYMRNDTILSADKTSVIALGTGAFVKDENGDKIPIMLKVSAEDEEATVPYQVEAAKIKLETKKLEEKDFDSDNVPIYSGEVITTGEGLTSTTFYPLFIVYYYGKGKGGNDFGFKIERDASRDKTLSDGRRYSITFTQTLSTGTVSDLYGESFYFSFNPDAMFAEDSNVCEGLSSVYVNTDDIGEEKPLQLIIYDDNYKLLTEALSEFKDPSETNNDIDFINCLFKNGNPYGRIILDESSIDVANSIVTLDGGNDGDLDLGEVIDGELVTEAKVAETKEQLLQKFFTCDIDDDIFDEVLTDVDILPDCNYSMDIKKTILQTFHGYRPDIKVLMDAGISHSWREGYNNAIQLLSFINTEIDYMVSINPSCGTMIDSSVGSPYEITYIYDYVKSLTEDFNSATGAFQMHAGARRGKVRYMRPYWVCKKNKENMIEMFEENKINFLMHASKNAIMYGSESSQYSNTLSKLSSDRNTLVIGRAQRIARSILRQYTFDDKDISQTLMNAKEHIENEFRNANFPATITASVSLYQTKQDQNTENAHCDIVFTFPGYVKKFIVTIIAKRQMEGTNSSSAA